MYFIIYLPFVYLSFFFHILLRLFASRPHLALLQFIRMPTSVRADFLQLRLFSIKLGEGRNGGKEGGGKYCEGDGEGRERGIREGMVGMEEGKEKVLFGGVEKGKVRNGAGRGVNMSRGGRGYSAARGGRGESKAISSVFMSGAFDGFPIGLVAGQSQ